ncbi:MAG: DUF134 domain-containing protein [Nanoarchaeota archaeon]|nr:DUF134 domain-containing protein [Nanoarchaeota archaeon]
MPRPRLRRRVMFQPGVTYFKPAGVPMGMLVGVVLAVDEFEAIRLKDYEGHEQSEAAEKMGISQPTFHRLILCARKKIADAIINGKSIRIEGGNYKMVQAQRPGMGREMGQGRGLGAGMGSKSGAVGGRMGGPFAAGPVGKCQCPKCGYEQEHVRGQPCINTKCPKCGSMMVRENNQ